MIVELESKVDHYRTIMHLCQSEKSAEVYNKLMIETKEKISKLKSEDLMIQVAEPVEVSKPPEVEEIFNFLRGVK